MNLTNQNAPLSQPQSINPIWSFNQLDVLPDMLPDVLPSNQNTRLSLHCDWLRARFVSTHVVYNIEDIVELFISNMSNVKS